MKPQPVMRRSIVIFHCPSSGFETNRRLQAQFEIQRFSKPAALHKFRSYGGFGTYVGLWPSFALLPASQPTRPPLSAVFTDRASIAAAGSRRVPPVRVRGCEADPSAGRRIHRCAAHGNSSETSRTPENKAESPATGIRCQACAGSRRPSPEGRFLQGGLSLPEVESAA